LPYNEGATPITADVIINNAPSFKPLKNKEVEKK